MKCKGSQIVMTLRVLSYVLKRDTVRLPSSSEPGCALVDLQEGSSRIREFPVLRRT